MPADGGLSEHVESRQETANSSAALADAQEAARSLAALADAGHGALAKTLGRLLTVVAAEASRSPRFARALGKALSEEPPVPSRTAPRRSSRRSPGPFDPFAVLAEGGSDILQERLNTLDLEQLRDIVAEHGMDNDRLAMKWKDRERVIRRILERVEGRAAKGSAFRDP